MQLNTRGLIRQITIKTHEVIDKQDCKIEVCHNSIFGKESYSLMIRYSGDPKVPFISIDDMTVEDMNNLSETIKFMMGHKIGL